MAQIDGNPCSETLSDNPAIGGSRDSVSAAGIDRHCGRLAAFQFFWNFLSRALEYGEAFFEELDRGRAAANRYEELRTGRATNLRLGERGNKARRLFAEIYADE